MRKINIYNTNFRWVVIAVFFGVITSCKNHSSIKSDNVSSFEVSDFNPLTNYGGNDSLKLLSLDYNEAIDSGFVIPSGRQTKEGVFISRFKIKNKSGKNQRFCYKLYYQNESYKFQETDASGRYNAYASENFYGSYENNLTGFKISSEINNGEEKDILDSIRIVGNPRDEKAFFTGAHNDRWKRNPRVGNYSFLLVIVSEEEFQKAHIPSYFTHLNELKETSFVNPYYYFLYGAGANAKEIFVAKSNTQLKVSAKPDLGTGIYESPEKFITDEQKSFFCPSCGSNEKLFKEAAVQQFVSGDGPATKMENIPVIADVIHDGYSKMDYNWNKSFYKRDELISVTPSGPRYPCQTVFSDSTNKKIIIKNPAAKFGIWRKESVGVITRHGFTYGKWRAKVKMTELLNKSNVWNGITNAIWLIYQPDLGGWNQRRMCPGEGYMAGYGSHKGDPRSPNTSYSEIDFEILKTVPYCPEIMYPPVYKNPLGGNINNLNSWNFDSPPDVKEHDGDITVSCTNWDMACPEPKNFNVGCHSVYYNNREFQAHRWDHWYNALTEKEWANDDELFAGKYYYFEIDWQPDKIIWRIGPEPDKMRIVGYMDNTVSSIPNNQMLLIIDQEWHNTKWWPISPYSQDNIPFPKNDIVGEIYEVVIE